MQLSKVRGTDVALCGAKAAQVGELMHIGLPVPRGFVVTTEVYRDFMGESGLDGEIRETLSQLDPAKLESVSDVSSAIQSMMRQYSIGDTYLAEILRAFDKLELDYVAVRSSPAVEHDSSIDFSAPLSTPLNVRRENLAVNIEHCWASLFSTRGLRYLMEFGFDAAEVLVAVAVQEMINAKVSGVSHTNSPTQGKAETLLIEAGWGLGEAMVSGIVSPDRYVVDKKTLEVKECVIGTQLKEVVREGDNQRIVDVPEARQSVVKLKEEQIIALAKLCLSVEKYYARPQKVEWAMDTKGFHLLQTKVIA